MNNKEFMGLQLFGVYEDEVVDLASEVCNEYNGTTSTEQLEIVKIAQLKRIADSLEAMAFGKPEE